MQVEAGAGYTVEDLWDFPDDGRRRELIDGVLYVTPPPRTRHQWVVGWLIHRLAAWVEEHGGAVFPGVNVDLDEGTHLEPDVAFVRPGREVGDVLSLHRPPDLVVEVSSPSTRSYDVGIKRERYAQSGAAEFWFVDLDGDAVTVWAFADARDVEPVVHRRGDVITSALLPGLSVDVNDILGPRR